MADKKKSSCIFYQLRAVTKANDKGNVKSFLSVQVRPSRAERAYFANTNRTAAGGKCLTRLQSVQSRGEARLWSRECFIYGDCKLYSGLYHSYCDSKLIGCRGLEVTRSLHFIYSSFLRKNGPIALSFSQAGDISWSSWKFYEGMGSYTETVHQMLYGIY